MAVNTAKKQRGQPFAKGQSGNPDGRPRGSRNKATLAVEALLEGEAEALTRKAIEKALEGDGVALRLCLERIAPARKDSPTPFAMPPVESIGDAVAASSAVLQGVAQGDLTPDEAGKMMGLLTSHKTLVELCDLEKRLIELENRQ